jgi:carbonic anhydrase/acetyltransferase-like protein (isoleucine patch superfamily)
MTLRKNPATSWLESCQPEIGEGTFVDPAAVVIGKVEVGKNCYIGPTAVLRGDEGEIRVGNGCNIQDGVIIHALKGSSVNVHDNVSLAHGCIIHGPAEIGNNSFVGFRSVILRSKIGKNCFIGHGCIIIGVEIPDGKLVEDGMKIKTQKDVEKLSDVGEEQKEFMGEVREVNLEFAKAYSSLHSLHSP